MTARRRSNSVAGSLMLGGALSIAAAAFLAWVSVARQPPGVTLRRILDVGAHPGEAFGSDDGTRLLLAAAAVVTAGLAVLLIRSRTGSWGVLWRLLAVVSLLLPALVAGGTWYQLAQSPGNQVASPVRSVGEPPSLGPDVGLITITPAAGVYLLTVGVLLAFAGCALPAAPREDPDGGASGRSRPEWRAGPTGPLY